MLCHCRGKFVIPFYTLTLQSFSPNVLYSIVARFLETIVERKSRQLSLDSCLLFYFLPLPFYYLTARLRYEEVNIFSDPSIVKTSNQDIGMTKIVSLQDY